MQIRPWIIWLTLPFVAYVAGWRHEYGAELVVGVVVIVGAVLELRMAALAEQISKYHKEHLAKLAESKK